MKPSIAEMARAYLLPAVATACSAQFGVILAIGLLRVPESAFQGATFRYGVLCAMLVSIVSVRRRAARAFAAALRSGEARLRAMPTKGSSRDGFAASLDESIDALEALEVGVSHATPAVPSGAAPYVVGVAASSAQRSLIVLYLQFRRIPFVIESQDRLYPSSTARHA